MRVGLLYTLGPDDSYDAALDQIEVADHLGLDSVLFEEHHGRRGCPAVGSLVTAAAARTSSIRVGTANHQLTLAHPVHTAESFAIADVISRGRVILGVSPGDRPEDFRAAGVPWDTREARFREAVDLVRAAWTQDSFCYVGEHVHFPLGAEGAPGWHREPFAPPYLDQWRRGQVVPRYLPVLPKPVQAPHPPIWVTGHRRDTIEWAARRGLTFLCPSLETEAEVRERTGWYREALAAAGRDLVEVEVAVAREVFLADDGDRARDLALPSLRHHVEALRAEATVDAAGLALAGGAAEADLLDSCFLVGSPAEVIDRLKALQADVGMTHLVCRVHLPGRDHLAVDESIRLLASQIATRLVA